MSRNPYTITAMFLTLIILLTLGSCGSGSDSLHILTDKKEMASVVEVFDASTDDLSVTMSYVEAIDITMIESEDPDLVIGDYLSSSDLIDIWEGYDASASTYPALDQPLLTPLSFELPLIMGEKDSMNTLPDRAVVSPEELREAASEWTIIGDDGVPSRVGFSPTWNPATFVDLLLLRYPESLRIGLENLDEAKLDEVVEETRSWVAEATGGPETDDLFNGRYRYIPDEYLILEGRIRFARTDFDSIARMPDSITNRLSFRYLTGPRHIPVLAVTAAGIPENSDNPKAAQRFIDWIVKPETQTTLIDRWEQDGIDIFGFLGGLSAISSVNNTIIVDRFPAMKGMIPENYYLNAPSMLPNRWFRIKAEVLAPWFEESIESPNSTTSLTDSYRKWDLSSLDEAD
ncbi:MAG: hypothetical protein P1P77_12160 [Spirochaetaceae bacterium]|nr:hypothetical protein [Spirochaetaceae bacterium]